MVWLRSNLLWTGYWLVVLGWNDCQASKLIGSGAGCGGVEDGALTLECIHRSTLPWLSCGVCPGCTDELGKSKYWCICSNSDSKNATTGYLVWTRCGARTSGWCPVSQMQKHRHLFSLMAFKSDLLWSIWTWRSVLNCNKSDATSVAVTSEQQLLTSVISSSIYLKSWTDLFHDI